MDANAPTPQGGKDDAPIEVHHDVTAGRARMRIAEWRSSSVHSDHPPILALPGMLAPRVSFRPLAEQLQNSFRVIAVDFPGFGESEKPSPSRYPYGVEAFGDGLADLFGGLGLSRAHVLGHGLGGAVALHLAARHPELVARLCLIAPMAHQSPKTSLYRALLAPLVGGLVFRQLVGRSAFRRLYDSRVNPNAPSEVMDEYFEVMASPAARAALLATLRSSLDTRGVIADSRRVRSPTLLVWGRHDRLFPLAQGRRLSREMPQAGLEILETGHAPHEEAPARVAEILERFYLGNRAGSR